jgi:hypothetical protein
MSRLISVLTAIAWIPLFPACLMALRGEGVRASDFATVTPVIIVVCCVIALSIWSAVKPRRVIAWVLLVVSLAPACFLGPIAYNQIRGYGVGYLVSLSWTVGFWLWETAVLVILPFLWAAVCWRWRRGVVNAI